MTIQFKGYPTSRIHVGGRVGWARPSTPGVVWCAFDDGGCGPRSLADVHGMAEIPARDRPCPWLRHPAETALAR